MLNALFIQHNETNDAATVAETRMNLHAHRSDENPVLPSLEGFDALILGGGPQTATSDDGFGSRRAELNLIEDALSRGLPVLGICLGSQLLALATGGTVYRRPAPEIGWLPVELTAEGVDDPLFDGCPTVFSPKHSHFYNYTLPPGAVRLATSEACDQQGFRLGSNAYGLQFHFEANRARAYSQSERRATDGIKQPSLRRQLAGAKALHPIALQMVHNFERIVEEHHGGSPLSAATDALSA